VHKVLSELLALSTDEQVSRQLEERNLVTFNRGNNQVNASFAKEDMKLQRITLHDQQCPSALYWKAKQEHSQEST